MRIREGFQLIQDDKGHHIARAVGPLVEEFPDAIQMGLSGAFLWDRLTWKDCSRAELIFDLGSFYEEDIDTEQIAADVDMFLEFLREHNILAPEI